MAHQPSKDLSFPIIYTHPIVAFLQLTCVQLSPASNLRATNCRMRPIIARPIVAFQLTRNQDNYPPPRSAFLYQDIMFQERYLTKLVSKNNKAYHFVKILLFFSFENILFNWKFDIELLDCFRLYLYEAPTISNVWKISRNRIQFMAAALPTTAILITNIIQPLIMQNSSNHGSEKTIMAKLNYYFNCVENGSIPQCKSRYNFLDLIALRYTSCYIQISNSRTIK